MKRPAGSTWNDAMSDSPTALEVIARRFHEVYEELAPAFDYETRSESATAWEHVPANNRALMVSVVYCLVKEGVIAVPVMSDSPTPSTLLASDDYPASGEVER